MDGNNAEENKQSIALDDDSHVEIKELFLYFIGFSTTYHTTVVSRHKDLV
jgi:hypothetical protein